MDAAQFLKLLDYFRNWFLGLAPDDPAKAQKLVHYLQERGLIKRVSPPSASDLMSDVRDGEALLTVREAADLLNVSTKWVYLHYETLPYIPFGAGPKPRLRFRRKALLAWIERHEIDWRRTKGR